MISRRGFFGMVAVAPLVVLAKEEELDLVGMAEQLDAADVPVDDRFVDVYPDIGTTYWNETLRQEYKRSIGEGMAKDWDDMLIRIAKDL